MVIWKQFMEYHQRIDPYYGTVEGGHLLFGEYIKERMGRDDSLVLVALDGSSTIGYCLCYIQNRPPIFTESQVGVLSDLAVGEEHRGSGAGGALLKAAIVWLQDNGIKRVELRTSAMNDPAIDFYRRHGFWVYDHMMTREI